MDVQQPKKVMTLWMQRFRLVSDDDGHHYIIPADNEEMWNEWVCRGEPYELPDCAYSIGGSPTHITFENWKHE